MDNIIYYVLSAVAVLITLTVHEYAHGYAAYKLGDDTAKSCGRLTLNPIKHLDPFGAVCMVLFHIGWAKPVPINPRNFKNPKRDFAISSLAGPLSNIVMAFFGAFVYLLSFALLKNVKFTSEFLFALASNFLTFLFVFHSVNIGIAIFNLIPIPPLDGSRILNVVLPPQKYFSVMKYERYFYYGLLAWLLFGDVISSFLLSVPLIAANPALSVIAKIFSLSDMLGAVIGWFSDIMFKFWQLIPFLK